MQEKGRIPLKRIKQIPLRVFVLLMCISLIPINTATTQAASQFPLTSAAGKLVADAYTEYITYFTQDPTSKLITATVQIKNGGTGTTALEISGVGIQISFDSRVAPYYAGDTDPFFKGRSFDIPDFEKYIKTLVPSFDTIGTTLIQNDTNGRFMGGKLSCNDADQTIEIPAGQTVAIAEIYFMPLNRQDTLDVNMFKYEYITENSRFLRLTPWIGNGSTFLQSDARGISSQQTYVVNAQAFKIMGPWNSNDVTPYIRKVGEIQNPARAGSTSVGDEIKYTITVSNTGKDGSVWANAVLTDTINQYVTFNTDAAKVQAPGSWNYDAATRVFTAQLGNISKGQTVTVVFHVTVNNNAQGRNITNNVTVKGKDGTDSNADDVTATIPEDGGQREVYTEQSQSSMPTIDAVTAGATVIRGTGVPGASITVSLPNGVDLSATVNSNNGWSVNVPSSSPLVAGNTITARQTEPGKTQSQPVTITVSARSSGIIGGGNVGGGGTPIVDRPPPLAGFTLDHIPYINGYPDNTVRPNNPITRAEAASIFFRLLTAEEKNNTFPVVFSDVRSGAWYTQAVNYLASIEIITGYPDGTFRPDRPISRAEFAAIASRFDNLAQTSSNAFSDISNHWAVSLINSAYAKGWISGFPDGTFRPTQNITRAEVVTVVNRMLDRRVLLEDIPAGIKAFTDIASNHWAYTDIVEASNDHDYIRGADGFESWRLK